MLDARLFSSLEAISRAVRNNSRPFGGIQLLLCGDFFQVGRPPQADTHTPLYL
jgi:ATP-dependent DNA helicase PIF1